VVTLQLATGWRYGLFRDELYYLACASHLDWGYVDHPPLSIIALAGVRGLLGDSLLAVRLVPAMLFGLLVWLAARLARELGGGRFAQSLAALSVAIAPEYLALTGFYSMNAFDLVFWGVAALLLTRLVRTDDAGLWRPLGLVVGLGLLNKMGSWPRPVGRDCRRLVDWRSRPQLRPCRGGRPRRVALRHALRNAVAHTRLPRPEAAARRSLAPSQDVHLTTGAAARSVAKR
jgi:hypothetical protein